MIEAFIVILSAVLIGGALVLTAVALGGFLVHRTKLPNERLFSFKPPELGVYDTDNLSPQPQGRPESVVDTLGANNANAFYSSIDPLILQQNRRFQDQLAAERKETDDA